MITEKPAFNFRPLQPTLAGDFVYDNDLSIKYMYH